MRRGLGRCGNRTRRPASCESQVDDEESPELDRVGLYRRSAVHAGSTGFRSRLPTSVGTPCPPHSVGAPQLAERPSAGWSRPTGNRRGGRVTDSVECQRSKVCSRSRDNCIETAISNGVLLPPRCGAGPTRTLTRAVCAGAIPCRRSWSGAVRPGALEQSWAPGRHEPGGRTQSHLGPLASRSGLVGSNPGQPASSGPPGRSDIENPDRRSRERRSEPRPSALSESPLGGSRCSESRLYPQPRWRQLRLRQQPFGSPDGSRPPRRSRC